MSTEERIVSIKAWMKLKGLNHQKLSDISGVSLRTLSRIFSVEYSGQSGAYSLIADALGLSLAELFAGPDHEIVLRERLQDAEPKAVELRP